MVKESSLKEKIGISVNVVLARSDVYHTYLITETVQTMQYSDCLGHY